MESGRADLTDQRFTVMALCALALCTSFVALGFYSISVALSSIQDHFSSDPHAQLLLPLIGGIVPLAFALSSPLIGGLIERMGVRTVFMSSLLLLAVAGVAPALLNDLPTIVAMRALVGVAIAGVLNAGITGTGLLTEPTRTRMFGIISTLGAISGIVSFPLAGLLASWTWRAVFLLPLFALAVIPLALYLPRLGRSGGTRPGPQDGTKAPYGLLLLAAFTGLVTYAAPMFLPFYLYDIGLTSPALTSIPLLAMSSCSLAASSGYALWRGRFGLRGVFVAGYGFIGAAFLLAGNAPSLLLVTVAMAIFGIGLGCIYPNLNTAAVFLGRANSARVIGKVNASLYGAQVLFPYIAGPIRTHAGSAAVFLIFGTLSAAVAGWFLSGDRLALSHT